MTSTSENSMPRLFTVTLAWNPSNSDDGEYCTQVWAMDGKEAIESVAAEMAMEAGASDNIEAYVARRVASADEYAASLVVDDVMGGVTILLSGPDHDLTTESKADLEMVRAILKKYGAS